MLADPLAAARAAVSEAHEIRLKAERRHADSWEAVSKAFTAEERAVLTWRNAIEAAIAQTRKEMN
jgi:hypothetical protein